MPLYEYQCPNCEAVQECLIRSEQEERSLTCLGCGSKGLKKLISTFSLGKSSTSKPDSPQGRKSFVSPAELIIKNSETGEEISRAEGLVVGICTRKTNDKKEYLN